MITTLAIQLEAWVQEEIGAQGRLSGALAALERAVRAGQARAISTAGTTLEAELAHAPAREARRRVLLGRIAASFGLAPQGLTLARVVARLEVERVDVARLTELRAELRTRVAEVKKVTRRLAAMAQYHRGLFDELCQKLLDRGEGASSGQLVDARG
jgi:hypothetical protein